MSAGLAHGFRRGYWNAIGLQLALIVQVGIVAAGIGAVLARSELAFSLIKWFGVAYLLYLGWKQWSAPVAAPLLAAESGSTSARKLLLRGFVVNASNPKAIVFILAVLPQFIAPAPGDRLISQQAMKKLNQVGKVMGVGQNLGRRSVPQAAFRVVGAQCGPWPGCHPPSRDGNGGWVLAALSAAGGFRP